MNTYSRVGAFLVSACVLSFINSAPGAFFSGDTRIAPGDLSYEGQSIVASNCTLIVDGPHAFANLQLSAHAVLSHSWASNGVLETLVISTNDQLVLSGTNALTLNNSGIVVTNVTVTDPAGSIFYTNATDYNLVQSNGMTTISRTDTSAIPDGGQVLVTYTYLHDVVAGLNLVLNGNLEVDATSSINADGKGFGSGLGPGAGSMAAGTGGGGGLGGCGSASLSNAPGGTCYGVIAQPVELGSGGGASYAGPGALGGGSITLQVTGTLRIDGSVSANGLPALSSRAGGGAGGSIWLSATSFSGSGSISADGGAGEPSIGGGGGGGRIALYYDAAPFTGSAHAHGGRGPVFGGAGTLYIHTNSAAFPFLKIENAGQVSTNTMVSLNNAPAPVAVIENGATMSVSTPLSFQALTVSRGSSVNVAAAAITVATDVLVEDGASISADGLGYSNGGRGSGGGYAYGMTAGAGYGGFGGLTLSNDARGPCYGSFRQPVDLGSGGGPYFGGAAGGGAIRMIIGGQLLLNGKISADGKMAVSQGAGGASGGSLWITAGTLAGPGVLSALGSPGRAGGGGGGGGRIALYLETNNFSGAIRAWGAGSGSTAGGPGSIYSEVGSSVGQLLFDNGGALGLSSITIGSPPVGLRLQNGAVVGANLSLGLSSLLVSSNSWLLVTNANPVVVGGDALIEHGGGISSDGLGYASGQGPGFGHTLTTNVLGVFSIGTGAGHGGYGATTSLGGVLGGNIYDLINAPSLPGSGGGPAGRSFGSSGGGVAMLIVSNRLTLEGRISADALPASDPNTGGGSGGTVRITANQFDGTGIVSACGGSGRDWGGSGGGGRISIFCPTNLFAGSVMAYGGGTSNVGGAGTIYLKPDTSTSSSVPATIIVDNGGLLGTNTDAFFSFPIADLKVIGGAVANVGSFITFSNLFIGSNSWLRAPGPTCTINLTGNATVEAAGGIRSAGALGGQGTGRNGSLGSTVTGGGGGFGGTGGGGAGAYGGNCYDFAVSQQSSAWGSSGASAGISAGGLGGGGIFLTSPGTVQLDGSIIADGLSGSGTNSGGGSGGSIRVSAGSFKGSGLLSANGGRGPGLGGGGGGGRLYVINYGNSRSNLFTGTMTAYGGEGFNRGGAGTIYLQSSNLVLVDNHGFIGTNTVLNDSNGNFDVLIRNGGIMALGNTYYAFYFRNVTVGSNGWLLPTHSMNLSGDVVIERGGGIVADKLGYGPDQGPGAGRVSSGPLHGGGGHGGPGGANAPQYGIAYDDFSHPTQAGSGGSSGSGSTFAPLGGVGGGVVNLNMNSQRSTLRVDGIISASGGAGDINSGGGAGGSVAIYANTLVGTGSIVANGGAGNGSGGGGGGGLIMIYPFTNLFTGSLTANGGNGIVPGGAGIVYAHTPSQAGNIVLDNAGLRGPATPLYNRVGPVVDLTAKNGAAVAIIGQNTMRNLDVLSGAAVLFSSDSYASLTLNGNASISADSSVNADGRGYPPGTGPGAGAAIGSPAGTVGGGGAHAGAGAGPRGGLPYGSITIPREAGSGGSPGTGGYGGGVVNLTVNGTLQTDGRISANGNSGTLAGGGGGAGGAVVLWAGTLAGGGSISADGGAGYGLGGGGGGGSIRIGSSTNQFSGPITALGGGGSAIGGAGTIYLPDQSGQGGVVLLDNGGQAGTNTQLILPWPLDLRIQNGAIAYEGFYGYLVVSNLTIGEGGTLTCRQGQTNITATVIKDAFLQTNGLITADAVAFEGDGQGLSTNSIGSGAGHGGIGGASSLSQGGSSYGSERRPLEAGSSGGEGFPSYLSDAAGGGVIRLNVGGSLSNNGLISANGGPGLQDNSGGGSGGGILIQATTMAGNGGITAKGGAGELFEGGGGGGGRIAIYSHTNAFGGAIAATGAEGWTFGEDGSVYLGTTFDPLVVLSHTPSGVTTNSVDVIKLELSNPPVVASGDTSKFSLTDPNGTVITNFVLMPAGVSSLAVSVLPTLSTVGDYTFTIQPGLVSDVFGQPLSQSYTGTFHITLPLISGVITNLEGQPLPGILVQTTIGSSAITDANGAYAIGAVPGQFITLTPMAPDLFFVPAERTYYSVSTNISNESYLAVTSLSPILSYEQQGTNLVMNWTSIPGVSYQVFSSSDLTQWLPFSDLMPGTGGPLHYVVTVGTDPALFFRLEVLR